MLNDYSAWIAARCNLSARGFNLPFHYRDLIAAKANIPHQLLDEYWASQAIEYLGLKEGVPGEQNQIVIEKLEQFNALRYRSPEISLAITAEMKIAKRKEMSSADLIDQLKKDTDSEKRALLCRVASQFGAKQRAEGMFFEFDAGYAIVMLTANKGSRTARSLQYDIELRWKPNGDKRILLNRLFPGLAYYDIYDELAEAVWGVMANCAVVIAIGQAGAVAPNGS